MANQLPREKPRLEDDKIQATPQLPSGSSLLQLGIEDYQSILLFPPERDPRKEEAGRPSATLS